MNKRKLILVWCIVTLLSLGIGIPVSAYEHNHDEAAQLDTTEITKQVEAQIDQAFDTKEIDDTLKEYLPGRRITFRELVYGLISDEKKMTASMALECIRNQVFGVLQTGSENLGKIILLALMAALFYNFSNVFESKQVCEISFYLSYLLLLILCLNTFQTAIEWVEKGILAVTSFLKVFCPLFFLAVSLAKGSVTAIAFYQMVLLLILGTEMIIGGFVLPAVHVYILVRIMNYLSEKEYLTKCSEMIEWIVRWSLKTLLACVMGLNLVQGMMSPAIDTVKRNAVTKTAEALPGVGNVVGGMTELVLGTAVLVKNGIGTAGFLICILICAVPLLQTCIVAVLYKLTAAVLQPISDHRIIGCIDCVGDGCQLLMQVIFTSGILFLLTIVVVCFVTNQG